jgi:hypothetical protein
MGFLDDLGLDDVDGTEPDWSIPNGVYPAYIVSSEIISGKTPAGTWQIKYRINTDYPEHGGKYVSEFFDLDPALEDKRKSFLKRRLVSLDITNEQARDMDPGDIVGVNVVITVKNKVVGDNKYTNVTKVELDEDAGDYSSPTGGFDSNAF